MTLVNIWHVDEKVAAFIALVLHQFGSFIKLIPCIKTNIAIISVIYSMVWYSSTGGSKSKLDKNFVNLSEVWNLKPGLSGTMWRMVLITTQTQYRIPIHELDYKKNQKSQFSFAACMMSNYWRFCGHTDNVSSLSWHWDYTINYTVTLQELKWGTTENNQRIWLYLLATTTGWLLLLKSKNQEKIEPMSYCHSY